MTVIKGFLIVILSGIGFAIGGALIGSALAMTIPGYYRAVFSSGQQPWFDPVEVGLGLGLTQGVVCGLLVGSVIVLAVAWYNSRRGALEVEFRSSRAGVVSHPVAAQGITSHPG